DRLHAAEAVDLIRPGKVLGGNYRRRRPAFEGRRASRDAPYTRHASGNHRHVSGGQQRVLSAGDIATDGIYGHVLVAKHDPRQGLDLDIGERAPLRLGEAPYLGLGKANIREGIRADGGEALFDLALGQPKVPAVEFVEASGQLVDSG